MKKNYSTVILIMLLVIILWLASYFVVWWLSSKYESASEIGDAFGAINALFSGLAFFGTVYTLYKQQEQIHQDKIDQEKERQKATIFQLLTFQNNTLQHLSNGTLYGRGILNEAMLNLKNTMKKPVLHDNDENYILHKYKYLMYYDNYIKSLDASFTFIAANKYFTDEEKQHNMVFFKSQVSSVDLILWAYNLHFSGSTEGIIELTREYEIFKMMNRGDLGNIAHYDSFTNKHQL